MVDVVLNSASLTPLYPADDPWVANHVEDLIRGLACLENLVLRASGDLWAVPLVEGAEGENPRFFAELVQSFYWTPERHDVAAFFDDLQRMAPADAGFDDALRERLLTCVVSAPVPDLAHTFAAVQAAGLHAVQCALTDAILASLCRDVHWHYDRMGFIDDQVGHPFTFDHIGTAQHGAVVAERRRGRIRDTLTARSFWDRKGACYPNLRFGQEVETQIKDFGATVLGLAFKRLGELDEFSAQLREGAGNATRAEKEHRGIRPETPATMACFGQARRFRDSNGAPRMFEEHVWVDGLYRIHIFMHTTPPIIEIGYMGRHLPTSTNPS